MAKTYIIGEIGQNHNGSVEIARQIIDMATSPVHEDFFDLDLPGIDAVKLTKRDLSEELSASEMNKPYVNKNSFGATYGEHRAFLELPDETHFELYRYAKAKGVDFVETLCAPRCLSLLKLFTPDRLKVASRDLTNLPLLAAMAETKIPMILSTGMGGKKELDDALAVISRYHSDISILHCVSQYPTRPEHVNLLTIEYLKKNYPGYVIGFSDHTIGVSASVVAVGMGAQIIEKHITLDRRMKGTDQACSLGPDGLRRMIRDIRLCEEWKGTEALFIDECCMGAKIKLERSIAAKRTLLPGERISEEDIHLLSPGDGFRWAEKDKVVGKTVLNRIEADEIIYPKDIQA